MTLILCPECKREISDQANTCPHCGFPIEKLEIHFLKRIKQGQLLHLFLIYKIIKASPPSTHRKSLHLKIQS